MVFFKRYFINKQFVNLNFTISVCATTKGNWHEETEKKELNLWLYFLEFKINYRAIVVNHCSSFKGIFYTEKMTFYNLHPIEYRYTY